MENWGCEFLDNEHQLEFSKVDRIILPLELVDLCVDQEYIHLIKTQKSDYIENLAQDIEKRGLKRPLQIVVSVNRVNLMDGNHRYCALKLLKTQNVWVEILETDKSSKQNGINSSIMLATLLRKIYEI